MYCSKCATIRKQNPCFKCGSDTIEPDKDWDDPELPDIEVIRKLAKEVGYAIAVHGSLERDLDIVAIPWVETAVGNYDLLQHLAKGLDARIVETERKPLGRIAATLQLNGWYKLIDLSICPRIQKE